MSIPPDEKLTYFISAKTGFSIENKEVKARAFRPTKKSPNELSVYRISSLSENQVWEIGKIHVEDTIKIKARADFPASIFYENHLFREKDIKVIPAPYPHELHANITPIPVNKEDRKQIFDELTLFCELVVRPENV